jgi:hypothetical protein
MEQSPSTEANRSSATQKIPRILWNPKVQHSIYKSPPPVPVLNQTYPIHALQTHFSKIHFNIILPPKPEPSKWSPSLGFPQPQRCVHPHLLHTLHISVTNRVKCNKMQFIPQKTPCFSITKINWLMHLRYRSVLIMTTTLTRAYTTHVTSKALMLENKLHN